MTPLQLFTEAVIGGLFTGLMYSLVALGFVLIYKASTAFNFAQGAMVFFAAMTLVGFIELGAPFWFALLLAIATMILLGVATERFIMRPLVNQHEITLFMATIGLAFMVEGLAQMLWGVDVRRIDLGIQDVPIEWVLINAGLLITQLDLFASVVAGVLVATLAVVFSRTKVGRGLRAVADDHAAALAVGIPLQRIWAMVWAVAGIIALVAGMLWGSRAGVQFALALIALKALPVLIIGGFTSVPGVIVAGLIVGVAERTFEVYIGSPILGGGTEVWFPFVFAILFLLVRPEGLFGEKIIRRV
jgi:branched-chain amino acid transport system permease protein